MIIDLLRLNNNIEKSIPIDEELKLSEEDLKKADLLDLKDTRIKGTIYKNAIGNIEVELNITGIMVLECARTLKPVDYPFNINVDVDEDEIAEIDENFKKNQNSLDILPIIWENILVEIPMRVVSEDATEIEIKNNNSNQNSAFEKLKSLL